ncbi:MAG: sulfatase [Bacteroidota bacterium]
MSKILIKISSKKTIHLFLLITTFLLLTSFNAKENVLEEPPNFLFIAVDDLNTFNSVLGIETGVFLEKVYPDLELRKAVVERLSPNLKAFSQKALTFTHAYTASPLCGPSRTALLTGVPPHVSGYYQHDKHFRHYPTLTKTITLPQHLRKNGYFTAGIGKVFHKGRAYLDRGFFSDWPDRLFSWDSWIDANSGTGAAPNSPRKGKEKVSKYWERGDKPARHFTRFGVTDLPSNYSNDFVNAQHIADLMVKGQSKRRDIHGDEHDISLPADQPFFLACGIFAPHLPWIAPQELYDLFPPEEMSIDQELLEWVKEDLQDLSETSKRRTKNTDFTKLLKYGIELDGAGGDINAWKAAFQAYLATVAYADRCIGVLTKAIEENPRKENTIVVLWSDHGYHIGDKNREGKTTLWEASNRCNLMIYDPRSASSNKNARSSSMVSLQDIYPTLSALAGLVRPKHVHGRDLSPLVKDPRVEWQYPILSTFNKSNHSLRTADYRYIRYANGDQELYHMKVDPLEYKNLINDEKNRSTVESMDQQLDEILKMKPADYKDE